jgi:hypothetical protein
MGERAASLARHPSGRGYRPPVAALAARVAARLAADGAAWPEVAAAVLAARAASGLGPAAFALARGLPVAELAHLERHGCPPSDLPQGLV